MFGLFNKKTIHTYLDQFFKDRPNEVIFPHRIDANARDKEGYTALTRLINDNMTLFGMDYEFIEKLMKAGANPLLPILQGEEATILESITTAEEGFTQAAVLKMKLIIDDMMDRVKKGNIHLSETGGNFLHIACRNHQYEGDSMNGLLVQSCVAFEDKPDLLLVLATMKDRQGNTPLQKLWEGACKEDCAQRYSHAAKQMAFWHAHQVLSTAMQFEHDFHEHHETILDMAEKASAHGFEFLWEHGEALLAEVQARKMQREAPPSQARPSRRF